jgi:hypothetical protein
MILDGFLQFSSGQTIAAVVSTIVSTNIIDLGVGLVGNQQIPTFAQGGGARDIGIGDDPALKFLVQISTTVTSGGAATLVVALQGAIDNGSGAPAAFSTWWSSPAYALATLVAGARLFDMDMPRPPDGIAIPRYLQLAYTIGGATTTAGNISSYLVLDRHDLAYQSTQNAILGGYLPGVVVAN